MTKFISLKTALCLIGLGAACWLAFGALGSHVDEQGMLREPFGLVPAGLLSMAAGAVVGVLHFTRSTRSAKPKP